MNDPGTLLFTSEQVAKALGISYRQLDHWTRQNYIVPTIRSSGPGTLRRWSLIDMMVIADFVKRVGDCPLPHGVKLEEDR